MPKKLFIPTMKNMDTVRVNEEMNHLKEKNPGITRQELAFITHWCDPDSPYLGTLLNLNGTEEDRSFPFQGTEEQLKTEYPDYERWAFKML